MIARFGYIIYKINFGSFFSRTYRLAQIMRVNKHAHILNYFKFQSSYSSDVDLTLPAGWYGRWTETRISVKSKVAVNTGNFCGPDVSSSLGALLVAANHGISSALSHLSADLAQISAPVLWHFVVGVLITMYRETSTMAGLGALLVSVGGFCCTLLTRFRRVELTIPRIRTRSKLGWISRTSWERDRGFAQRF